ncbi:MAG: hypothetical protein AAFR17_06475 [Pseudomonadota bacterium]
MTPPRHIATTARGPSRASNGAGAPLAAYTTLLAPVPDGTRNFEPKERA